MFPVDDLLLSINRLIRRALDDGMPAGRLIIDFDPTHRHIEVSWDADGEPTAKNLRMPVDTTT